MKNSKRWFKSKTLLVNALAAVAVLVQLLTGNDWLNAEAQVAIVVLVNVILRVATNTGLEG